MVISSVHDPPLTFHVRARCVRPLTHSWEGIMAGPLSLSLLSLLLISLLSLLLLLPSLLVPLGLRASGAESVPVPGRVPEPLFIVEWRGGKVGLSGKSC